MQITFIGGPRDDTSINVVTPPDKIEFPSYLSMSKIGTHVYLRRNKTHSFDFSHSTDAKAPPEIIDRPIVTKSALHRLKMRIEREKKQADKIRQRLGLPTSEIIEKTAALDATTAALSEIQKQLAELDALKETL